MEIALVAAALLVAFVNGANDNMKGVATLYGSGVLSYPRALALATVSTAAGSLASLVLAQGLVHVFSAKGIVPDALVDTRLMTAVAMAAALTVLLATRLGFPVSTTHALVGGIAGAGIVAAGSQLDVRALAGSVVVPLVAGPLAGVVLAGIGVRAGSRVLGRIAAADVECVCVDVEPLAVGATAPCGAPVVAMAADSSRLAVTVGRSEDCARHDAGTVARVRSGSVVDGAHLLSASLVGFARGVNDTPKILGLLVGAAVVAPTTGAIGITLAMVLGGLLAARRVAETMARKITTMTPAEGLVANLSTSLLVIGASRFGMPVSTTHVSTGGIVGIGQATGTVRWGTTLEVLAAWLTTLPLAALLGAGTMWLLR